MRTPFTKEACDVAANLISPLHPPRVRLLLGHDFLEYPQQWVNGGEVPFWVYVPTRDGGTLTIEFEDNTFGNIRVSREAKVVSSAVDVRRLVIDVPRGTFGSFEVRTFPPTARVRARLRQEWLATDGAGKPLIPWNFWYYPFGYEIQADVEDAKFSSRSVQLSALHKCDQVNDPSGETTPALTWEVEHGHVLDKPGSWEGHCDGAAAASVYFAQPEATALAGVDGGLTRDELEFVAAEWSGYQQKVLGDHFARSAAPQNSLFPEFAPHPTMGHVATLIRPDEVEGLSPLNELAATRYRIAFPKPYQDLDVSVHQRALLLLSGDDGRARLTDALGAVALAQYRFLSDSLGAEGQPIITNVGGLGSGPSSHGFNQIWNHALFYATVEFTERTDKLDKLCRDQPLGHDLEVSLLFNHDKRPGEVAASPARVTPSGVFPQDPLTLSFTLRLDYSFDGQIAKHDARHFVRSWAAANPRRWLPPSMAILGPPGGADVHYNPHIPDRVVRLLQRRPRYR